MNLVIKMFSSNVSKIIVTFAFFYSAIICYFKGEQLYNEGQILYAIVLWVCAFLSFIGALRFQVAKLIYFFRDKKW